jgi:23S rRNA pseudouridine1911/1915/1917 synthase
MPSSIAAPPVLWVTIADDPPGRIDKALSRDTPPEAALSRTQIARMIGDGAVRRGGEVVDSPKAPVKAGEVIELRLAAPVPLDLTPEDIPLRVVHEDADLIVIDKPAGMVVHPAPGSETGTLVQALLAHCGDSLSGIGGALRPGIVHRIDKETSGLLVVAKSDRAHHGLSEQFAAHSAARRYLAILHGAPDPGDPRLGGLPGVGWEPGGVLRMETRIGRHPHNRQRQAVLRTGGRQAVTRMAVVERFGTPPAAVLAECRLETGRTHQIRVHMAHIGHPLIGDPVYGVRRRLSGRGLPEGAAAAAAGFARQALHAATLGFVHPVSGAQMAFDSPLPEDMAALMAVLRGQEAP